MSAFIPVVNGETSVLRAEIEGMLTDDAEVVQARLTTLDEQTQAAGRWATFGAEVEFQFVPDPNAAETTEFDNPLAELYEEVVRKAQGDQRIGPGYGKGLVIHPTELSQMVMPERRVRGGYRTDQPGSEIIEVRTAPAGAVEANERYWRTIDAVGSVAAQHGYLGMILSTHINSAVWRGKTPIDFFTRAGAETLAAVQHNLVASYPLQADAGVESGVVVLEAWPQSKSAATTVHQYRLEFRHPTIGVADPRIDMLTVLDGVQQVIDGAVPQAASRQIRAGYDLSVFDSQVPGVQLMLENGVVLDKDTRKLVMPVVMDNAALDAVNGAELDELVTKLTNGRVTDALADNALVLRDMVDGIDLVGDGFAIDSNNPYAHQLKMALADASFSQDDQRSYRISPVVFPDNPEVHVSRRTHIKRSSTVRRMLGSVAGVLTPAADSVRRRQDLIDTHMIVLD